MRIARIGDLGKERPAVIEGSTAIYVDSIISDWSRSELERDGLARVASADFSAFPREEFGSRRIAAPIKSPTKVICVGLNYIGHIKEAGAETPIEPIIFMKSPDSVTGPNDDVIIPPGSDATDYEVELAIVIGKTALYLESKEQSRDYILGYSISQDISERHWQLERSGQWVKGKSFPTFNPIGPVIVTSDEIDASKLRLWCSVNGEIRQDSNTIDLLFGIDHIVWYVSQFMELHPGDIINTGTPFGVGLGFKPPKYLTAGDSLVTGIESIGEIRSNVISYVKGNRP
jgi:2-keto-4-pentenoate hydratase/2-oxohepta-3-ene-1,7-dioic acid hydratase in catechol pathway